MSILMDEVLSEDQENIVNEYYFDNAKKLRKTVDGLLKNFGGISEKDIHDFYSLANEVFTRIIKKYDGNLSSFHTFLCSCLLKRIKDEMSRRNAHKRTIDRIAISIDKPIDDNDSGLTIKDIIADDKDVENTFLQIIHENLSEKLDEYFSVLSNTQKDIAKLIMDGYKKEEIKRILDITEDQYKDYWYDMISYEKRRILFDNDCGVSENNMEELKMNNEANEANNIDESYKNTSYSISSISKRMKKKNIRDNHILQRYSGQWNQLAKSEFISDILRGKSLTQIIISEEKKNGVTMMWLIDGKQRCTTVDDYLHDGFAISKNVKNYNIKYQVAKIDEDGNEILDSQGFPVVETKEFDIRGKKFSKLPEELQDTFNDRQIPVLYNMNCTKKDIAEDIARFNRSRPMNKAQSGWLGIDENFGEMIDNISKMEFFQQSFKGSSYRPSTHRSGSVRRMIVEGIMVSDFINDFCKEFEKMCEFLSEEAGDSNFVEFYDLIERLTSICTEEISDLFNPKDSFLFFGLFSRFIKLNIEDSKFVDFLIEFKNSLYKKEVDGTSFEAISEGSTKDKSVVINKMKILENLMYEYFSVSMPASEDNNFSVLENVDNQKNEYDSSMLNFIKNNVDVNATQEDVELYEDCIKDIINKLENNTKLLDKQNRISLVAMMAYSFLTDNDKYINKWITSFFSKHNDYIKNQKQNYLMMKQDFDNYCLNAA